MIHRADARPFMMTGLWARWRREDGEVLESCTRIVTDANSLARHIHDRTPMILTQEIYGTLLDLKPRLRRAARGTTGLSCWMPLMASGVDAHSWGLGAPG